MNRSLTRLEIILLIAATITPATLVAGYFLVTWASEGNIVAVVILTVAAVLLIGLISNLNTILTIMANQRQDFAMLEQQRAAQRDAIETARLVSQVSKAAADAARAHVITNKLERVQLVKQLPAPEPIESTFLDAGTDVIEGLYEG